jgi:desulfoferrodoxin (superoxide reductase-like protein)
MKRCGSLSHRGNRIARVKDVIAYLSCVMTILTSLTLLSSTHKLTILGAVEAYGVRTSISKRIASQSSSRISAHVNDYGFFDNDESEVSFDDSNADFTIDTGDHLLDRRLALVRTVAMASVPRAAASTLAAFGTSTMLSSSSLPQPANALGRVELLINGIQSDPDIVASRNSNGDPTKHTPVVKLEKDAKGYGQILTVEVPHVMDFDKPHYIQYLWLQDVTSNPNDVRLGNIIAAAAFMKPRGKASSQPVVATIQAKVASGNLPTKGAYLTKSMTVKPCLYCNLHGLWEGEPILLGA